MARKIAQQSTSTDLGRLWADAIKDYNACTGDNLSAMGARNLDEVLQQTDAARFSFDGFRHDDCSKVSRFRSAMGDHLGDFQTCFDAVAAVGAAASAFPPAMPVGLIFTAASGLITVSSYHSSKMMY
jgi:hypothetical protein